MLRKRVKMLAKCLAGGALFLALGFASRLADDISSALMQVPGVPAVGPPSVVVVEEQAEADASERLPVTGDPPASLIAAATEPLPATQASEPERPLPDPASLRPVYASGYIAGREVRVSVPSSDVALPTTLERQVATLAAGACRDFGRWRPVDAVNVIPHGSCARYRTVIGAGATEIVAVAHKLVRRDDTPPPPPQLIITESSGNAHVVGDTFYYRAVEGEAGTFAVAAVSKDPESGVARLSFPALGEAAPIRRPGPRASVEYHWNDSGSTGAPTAGVIAATNAAGLASETPLQLVGDAEAPAGAAVSYPGGIHEDGSVEVALAAGEDALSGTGEVPGVLEQTEARLASGRCLGGWSDWHATEPGRSPGRPACIRFRYRVSDNVGNEAVHESSVVAKVVDAEAPTVTVVAPEDGTTVGETVTLAAWAEDTGFGVAAVRFEFNRSGRDTHWTTIAAAVAPYTAIWRTSGLRPGRYYVRALAIDRAGNQSSSELVAVCIVEPAVSEPTDTPARHTDDPPDARPHPPELEEPTSPELGTVPEEEPASPPEAPVLPDEPVVQPPLGVRAEPPVGSNEHVLTDAA